MSETTKSPETTAEMVDDTTGTAIEAASSASSEPSADIASSSTAPSSEETPVADIPQDAAHSWNGDSQPYLKDNNGDVEIPEYSSDRMTLYTRNLVKTYGKRTVVNDVSIHVRQGEIVGLVGESGCGKTTLAKAILGLHRDDTGEITHRTEHPQMVFQDAGSSLNPSKTVEWILQEPLRNVTSMSAQEMQERVTQMLQLVQLKDTLRKRYPWQLSGGQRQRVCIAAALMLQPEFLIADEPVSALDVTVQKQILSMLQDIVQKTKVSIFMISHDLRVVYQMCDHVLVMKDGLIVESGTAEEIYRHPKHSYTKALLESAGAST